jgi:Bacteriophage tail sheath protein
MDQCIAGLYPDRCAAVDRRRRPAVAEYLAPGVYVEEISSGAHAIAGVSTSTTAFLGATQSGPIAEPLLLYSFAEFAAQFGGLSVDMPLGYAVQQYFLNGGREALIGRVVPSGATLTDADLSSPALEAQQRGLWLLERAERFNILCIPPLTRATDVGRATWDAAIAYAQRRRAIAIVDPPAAWTAASDISETSIAALASRSPNAALYYPRLQAPDPLRGNQVANFAPCGAVAGIYARIDAARGVWKAPAGADATVIGVQGLSAALSDAQLAALNAFGVNGLRALPGGAIVVWGARTLAGNDVAEPYKYLPVRRLELFIEESIAHGLQWTVFEPNGPSLWDRIRSGVADFLLGLFRQAALAGNKPEDAFFVRCDASTMTQQEIDQGILNVVVGVAQVKPAEFVIIRIGSFAKDHACARFLARHHRHRHPRYTLRIMWDGQVIEGVRRVRGLGQLTELVTVHEVGADASQVIVGPTKFEPVMLERAITGDDAFEIWAQAMQGAGAGPPPRKDVRIELHDHERQVTVAWRLLRALVIKYEAPDLNATSNDVAVEQLTLAHEGLEFEDDPPC